MEPRAYSSIAFKTIDAEQRIIEGFASTPELDRGGDVMSPTGAKFVLPMPLLWQHQQDRPIGHVLTARVTDKGIHIRAKLEKGVLPFIDEAWALIKSGLVRGLSIGWRPLEMPEVTKGARHYKRWEWFETSTVTVPMNMSTTIAVVKSLDAASLAASGTGPRIPSIPPGASGQPPQARSMTTSEQLTAARTELQTKSARMAELEAQDSTEGGLNAAEIAERDGLTPAVTALNAKIARLSALEAAQKSLAQPITHLSPEAQRIHVPQQVLPKVEVKALPKGTGFTRVFLAIANGKGSYSDTVAFAKRWEGQTPEVVGYIKHLFGKAVEGTASSAASPNWGSELVYANNLASEFIELLNAATVIGRIEGWRRVPFNVRMVEQTEGATVNWVGEADPKPVTELDFTTKTQPWHKVAGIIVMTNELIRLGTPDAEALARTDLVNQIARFKDRQFLDPTVTATVNRPASITNGVPSPAASGTTAEDFRADLNVALATFDNAEQATESLVILLTPALARGLAALTNALGGREFPGLTIRGGNIDGIPVIVSSSVPSGHVIVIAASEILLSEDPNVKLDASNQATIDMAGGTSPTFSLWQRNCTGILAEQFMTWQLRRDAAVAIIDTAAYGPTAP